MNESPFKPGLSNNEQNPERAVTFYDELLIQTEHQQVLDLIGLAEDADQAVEEYLMGLDAVVMMTLLDTFPDTEHQNIMEAVFQGQTIAHLEVRSPGLSAKIVREIKTSQVQYLQSIQAAQNIERSELVEAA